MPGSAEEGEAAAPRAGGGDTEEGGLAGDDAGGFGDGPLAVVYGRPTAADAPPEPLLLGRPLASPSAPYAPLGPPPSNALGAFAHAQQTQQHAQYLASLASLRCAMRARFCGGNQVTMLIPRASTSTISLCNFLRVSFWWS